MEPLFSVTKADLRWDTFRAGGPGGQNQNKRETGARVTHVASGAVGESREHRTQALNKTAAFKRMVATETFKRWLALETMRRTGQLARVESEVQASMAPRNIKTEVHDEAGRWVETELP